MNSQFSLFFIIFLSFFIGCIFYFFSFLLSMKLKNRNKLSSFECGFSSLGSLTSSFSIHFFIFAVMFVLFELEVVLLLGGILSSYTYSVFFLIIFILLGLYLEYFLGKLNWMV